MTDMNESHEVIIKTDRRGRLRYSAEQKRVFIEAFEASGLSAPRFAVLHGVNYQTLVSWLKKHRSCLAGHPALRSLVPAVMDHPPLAAPTTPPLEILLPGGARMIVHTPGQIDLAADLIRKLQPLLSC